MSDSSAAKTPSEPRLCKMGCGFFGNGATEGCCSKCWRDLQKKQGKTEEAAAPAPKPQPETVIEPMQVETTVVQKAPAPTPKKKKKTTYKNMMAGMMKCTPERNVEKEKDALRKVTGGGAFSKIDKI